MRIIFVEPTLLGGGAERCVAQWAEHLTLAGWDVRLLAMTPMVRSRPEDPVPRRATASADEDVLQERGHLSRVRALKRHLRVVQPDVVVSVLTYANLLTCAAATWDRKYSLILGEHNSMARLLRSQGHRGRLKLQATRALYRRADAVFCVSHPVAADLGAAVPAVADRLWVLPNPVLPCLSPSSRSELSPPVEHGIRLLFVGRLEVEKRPSLVISTAIELAGRGWNVEVAFIGDGSLRWDLEAEAEASGISCSFSGWSDLWTRDSFTAGSCLVLPSVAEGFGNVLVEAAALGLPAVAPSEALGVGDAILPGVTGAFALSSEPGHLADAVIDALDVRLPDPSVDRWLDMYRTPASGARFQSAVEAVHQEHLGVRSLYLGAPGDGP